MNENKSNIIEVDWLKLADKLLNSKSFIFKSTIVGIVVGLIIALSIPKKYTASVTFLTNSNDLSFSNMGGLASLAANFNLGSTQSLDEFSTELYPDIVNSTPFVQDVLKFRVRDDKQNIDTTLFVYLDKYQRIPWWGYIQEVPEILGSLLSSEKGNTQEELPSPYFISREEVKVMTKLTSMYSVSTDKKTGITSITVTTQNPVVSAFLADSLTSYLQTFIINERTKKAKNDLISTEKLFHQAKSEYYKAQQSLAAFVDANQNLISARYKINQEKLQNEAQLSYSIYTQMAQQLQLNRIKVQDDTPVFTIIQPAVEPTRASKPSRKIILLGVSFLAFSLSGLWVLRKDLWNILIGK